MKKPATTASPSTRRGLLKALSAIAGSSLIGGEALAQTVSPRAVEGPFYPTSSMRMADVDNDLVRVIGLVQDAGGEVITLRGRITNRDGKARAGHRIEIWQCDLNGKYLHPSDNRNVPYDQGFQGFGHDITDADGNYSFRTIKPGRYPGRTPHIHVKVFEGDRELITTQFYVAGEPENLQDSLFRRMSSNEAESVSMRYVETADGTETTINLAI
jgi:protocatechuate 3,4-dioxygenase beta subunit